MKKILVCMLALMLVLSSMSVLADPIQTVMDPFSPYEETLTITTAKPANATPNFANPEDSQGDNAMVRYIEEKLNIDFQVVWESDDYLNKLALQLAANDLPDFFTINSSDGAGYLMYRQLVENGMLADLTDGYNLCLSDRIKRGLSGYNGSQIAAFTEDGKIYAYGAPNYAYDSNEVMWLRQDWMDALGLEAPQSLEDMENILIAFRDNYGAKGLSLSASTPMLWSAVAAAYDAYPGAWVEDENGEVVYGSLMQGTRDALELLARWYKEGLIDQEFVTRSDTTSLFAAGETGVLMGAWWMPYSIGQLVVDHPEAELSVHAAPLDADGNFNVLGPQQSGTILVVNAEFENPEAPMKMWSWVNEIYGGHDEEGFAAIKADVDNNASWSAMYPVGGLNSTPFDFVAQNGAYVVEYVETGVLNPDYEHASQLQNNRAITAKQFADGEATTGEPFINYYGWYKAANLSNLDCVNDIERKFSYTTESMADFKANLDAMEQTAFLKIIIGEEPIEYFDTFCEQWMAEGGEIVLTEVRELVGQ